MHHVTTPQTSGRIPVGQNQTESAGFAQPWLLNPNFDFKLLQQQQYRAGPVWHSYADSLGMGPPAAFTAYSQQPATGGTECSTQGAIVSSIPNVDTSRHSSTTDGIRAARKPQLTNWVAGDDGVATRVFTLENPVRALQASEDPTTNNKSSRWPASKPSTAAAAQGHSALLPSLHSIVQRHGWAEDAQRLEAGMEEDAVMDGRGGGVGALVEAEDTASTTQLVDEEGGSPENAGDGSADDNSGTAEGGLMDPDMVLPAGTTEDSPNSQAQQCLEHDASEGSEDSGDGGGNGFTLGQALNTRAPETTQEKVWAAVRHLPQLALHDNNYSPHARDFIAQSADWEGMTLHSDSAAAAHLQQTGKLLHMSCKASAPLTLVAHMADCVRQELDVALREKYTPLEGLRSGEQGQGPVTLPVPCKLPQLSSQAVAMLVNMHDNAVAPATTAMLRKPTVIRQVSSALNKSGRASAAAGKSASDAAPTKDAAGRAAPAVDTGDASPLSQTWHFKWADGQQRFYATLGNLLPRWVFAQPAAATSLCSSIMLRVTQLSMHPMVYVAYDHASADGSCAQEGHSGPLQRACEQACCSSGGPSPSSGTGTDKAPIGSPVSAGGSSVSPIAMETGNAAAASLVGNGSSGSARTTSSSGSSDEGGHAPSSHNGSSDGQTGASNTALATSSTSGSVEAVVSSAAPKPAGSASSSSSLTSKAPLQAVTSKGERVAASHTFMQLFGLAGCSKDGGKDGDSEQLETFLERAQVNPRLAYKRTRNDSSTSSSSGSGSTGSSSSDGGQEGKGPALVVHHHPPLRCVTGPTVVPRLKAITRSVACSASLFVFHGRYMHPVAPDGSARGVLSIKPAARLPAGSKGTRGSLQLVSTGCSPTDSGSSVPNSARGGLGSGFSAAGQEAPVSHSADPSSVVDSSVSPPGDTTASSATTGSSAAGKSVTKPASPPQRKRSGARAPNQGFQKLSTSGDVGWAGPASAAVPQREVFEAFTATEVVSMNWAKWRSVPSLEGMGMLFAGCPSQAAPAKRGGFRAVIKD